MSGGKGKPQGRDGSVDEVPAASVPVRVGAREQLSRNVSDQTVIKQVKKLYIYIYISVEISTKI